MHCSLQRLQKILRTAKAEWDKLMTAKTSVTELESKFAQAKEVGSSAGAERILELETRISALTYKNKDIKVCRLRRNRWLFRGNFELWEGTLQLPTVVV